MSETIKLNSADGHELDAYVALPAGQPIAGLVIIQEIFGVNRHIRSIADGYAKDGFLAVAPALFDRVERGVELPYDGPEAQKGMAILQKLDNVEALEDVDAALQYVRQQTGKKSGVIGYCLGGLLAWLSATRLHPPVQLHFGKLDTHIPAQQVDKVHEAHPEVEIYWHENAGHGFNCDMRASYNPEASALARTRALAFLKHHLM
jgi:carboxymethylenebutenolidase